MKKTVNFENMMFEGMKKSFVSMFNLENINDCINAVDTATEKFNNFLGEINDKFEELETAKTELAKAQETFDKKKNNLNRVDGWIEQAKDEPEYQEELRNTLLKKAEDEFAEAENALTAAETNVRKLEKFFADLKPVEQIVANKVESVKVETPKQEKKDDAIVDSKAVIKFAENGGYKVVINNGRELDCTIFQDVRNILDNLADEVFNGTFTVKYAKNRNKNSDRAYFVFFAKPNNG